MYLDVVEILDQVTTVRLFGAKQLLEAMEETVTWT